MSVRLKQGGLSLVELMVAIAISLFVILAVIAAFITTTVGGSNTLRQTKLNHELRSAMDIMEAGIRRAGYWGGAVVAGTPPGVSSANNPFTINPPGSDVAVLEDGTCLMYSYDVNHDGVLQVGEVFGFRLGAANSLEMLTGGLASTASCDAGTWVRMTDPNTVAVQILTFTLGSNCRNVTKEVNSCTAPAPAKDDLMSESRAITIALTGRHAADPVTQVTLGQQVLVQNDRIFKAPGP